MRLKKIIKRIRCYLKGHRFDWKEYDIRIEKEGHHAAHNMVYCQRCERYEVLREVS